MSPREDLTSIEAAIEHFLETTPTVLAPLGQEAAKGAFDSLDDVDHDIEWNVDPTDTSDVFELILNFVIDLRLYIEAIGGGASGSQFKDGGSLLKQAHLTVSALRRHHKLCKDYDASIQVRLTRPITDQGEELDELIRRGSEALRTLRGLIAATKDYLRRIM